MMDILTIVITMVMCKCFVETVGLANEQGVNSCRKGKRSEEVSRVVERVALIFWLRQKLV